jgi:hypothetical protein
MRTPALEPVNNQQRRRRRRSSVRRPTLASRSYVLAFGCGHSILTHRLRRRVPPPTRQPATRGAIGAKAHHATSKPVDNSSSFIDGRMNGVDLRWPGCLRRRATPGKRRYWQSQTRVTSNLAVRVLGCVPVSNRWNRGATNRGRVSGECSQDRRQCQSERSSLAGRPGSRGDLRAAQPDRSTAGWRATRLFRISNGPVLRDVGHRPRRSPPGPPACSRARRGSVRRR